MKIFVASTGRCGTKFMSEVFTSLTDIPSFHEPEPRGIGKSMLESNEGNKSLETKQEHSMKIAQVTKNARGGDYFESSHMFMKTFVGTIMKSFDDVYCIYLNRNPMDMLFSYTKIDFDNFPKDFFLQSHWKENVLRTTDTLCWYDNVLWNWFEIRERFTRWKHRFVKTYEFDFRLIENLYEYYQMFEHFGIQASYKKELPKNLVKDSFTVGNGKVDIPLESLTAHMRRAWRV